MKTRLILGLAVAMVLIGVGQAQAGILFRGLGALTSEFDSQATGVSADGLVVVGGSPSTSAGRAFRWTETSGMLDLGDLAGSNAGRRAYAVSADGAVVVGGSPSSGPGEAFRWM